jgi:predicted AAA+ superfamily ATPase
MVSMKARSLAGPVRELAFGGRKMAFVSGPRQCGKTTLAKMLLGERPGGSYRNWDDLSFRRLWATNPAAIIPAQAGRRVPLVVLDEIHKDRRWKRNLKGVWDTLAKPCDILVTGSARLNVYMKGSDSLLGRHLAFRLHPFSLAELLAPRIPGPEETLAGLFGEGGRTEPAVRDLVRSLMAYGPFPEPLLAQDARRARLWRRNHEQLVIREDLRDLSRLPELGRIEMMTSILPSRVGSLFSLAAMSRDLETSIPTVKRWLSYLVHLYYAFEVKPWSRNVPRALKREGKVYLWDYAAIRDESARFENLVACHLLKAVHYWTDTGEGEFELFMLRNKEKREIDFLVVRDGVPWLPVEVKLADARPSDNWPVFLAGLPCQRGLQVVDRPVRQIYPCGAKQVLVAGAEEALRWFT